MASGEKSRLTAAQRRETIIGAAIELLRKRGLASVTMERVAEQAGINKALPYRHFANAEAVLVEVLVRHMRLLGEQVLAAVEGVDGTEARLEAATTAYFDVVREHGDVMVLLQSSPAVDEEAAREVGVGPYLEHLFGQVLDVPKRSVPAVSEVVLATLATCASCWQRDRGGRRALEALAVATCLGAISHAQSQDRRRAPKERSSRQA